MVVREALLETMYLIAVSVNPVHLITEYRLECRTELLSHIKASDFFLRFFFFRHNKIGKNIIFTDISYATVS